MPLFSEVAAAVGGSVMVGSGDDGDEASASTGVAAGIELISLVGEDGSLANSEESRVVVASAGVSIMAGFSANMPAISGAAVLLDPSAAAAAAEEEDGAKVKVHAGAV